MGCPTACFAADSNRELKECSVSVSLSEGISPSKSCSGPTDAKPALLQPNRISSKAPHLPQAQQQASNPVLECYAGVEAFQQSATGSKQGLGSFCSETASIEEDRRQLQGYLLQHGHNIMALSTLQQQGLQYFVMPDVGYIAYAMMYNGPEFLNKRTAVVLSDPVCDVQHYRAIAQAFLQLHPGAMFAQVSATFAAVLQDFGFCANSMGGETRLDLAAYNFTGYARRGLRSAMTSATKEGITVHEVMQSNAGTLDAGSAAAAAEADLAAEMRGVDAQWAGSKAGRASEIWFINRPPIFALEPGVRKFVARDSAGALQAYVFFDGMFEDGEVVGYYANITRMLPDAHPGALNLIVKTFIETVRSERQLAPPTKKVSVKRSLSKKLQASAAAAASDRNIDQSDTAAVADTGDQRAVTPAIDAAAAAAAAAAVAGPPQDRPVFLSLGLSPLHQMDNSSFRHCPTIHKALLRFFEYGEAFYPFKTLAAAKAKYGAGLHEGRYEDPAVEYRQAYLCQQRGKTALVALFDLAKFFGFWKHPADAAARLVSHTIKAKLAARRSTAGGRDRQLSSSSSGSKCGSRCSSAASCSSAGSENISLSMTAAGKP